MPKRQGVTKIPTDEIQGKDSWVEFKALRVGRIREIIKQRGREGATQADLTELGIQVLEEVLIGWNWADEEGNPLPQPSEDKTQFENLTDKEFAFLSDLFQELTTGQAEQAKNLKRRSRRHSG